MANSQTDFSQVVDEKTIQATKKGLEERGFKVKIFDTLDQAKNELLKAIPDGSQVFTGTSVTLTKAGLDKSLNDKPFVSVREMFMPLYGQADKAVEMRRIGSAADVAVGSVHAITKDGQVLVASNSGSQLPSYAYGASKVYWLVGGQKLVKDFNQAMKRLEEYTLPLENQRTMKAYSVGSKISKLLIFNYDPQQRITIMIFRQSVGF